MLNILSQLSVLFPLVLSLIILHHFRVKKFSLHKVSKAVIFIACAQVVDSILFYSHSEHRILFYHTYTVIEYIVFSTLLISWETEYKIQLRNIRSFFLPVLLFVEFSEEGFDKIGMFIESIVLFALSARVFYLVVIFNFSGVTNDIRFWFVSSLLIYFSVNSLTFLLIDYPMMQQIHALTNILSNSIIGLGLSWKLFRSIGSKQQLYSLQS